MLPERCFREAFYKNQVMDIYRKTEVQEKERESADCTSQNDVFDGKSKKILATGLAASSVLFALIAGLSLFMISLGKVNIDISLTRNMNENLG